MERVKVRCVNPQPTLDGPCTWSGLRAGRLISRSDGTRWNGRTWRESPTRKRCPRCGGPVKEAP
jgi:hypothetical protein